MTMERMTVWPLPKRTITLPKYNLVIPISCQWFNDTRWVRSCSLVYRRWQFKYWRLLLILSSFLREVANCNFCGETLPYLTSESFCLEHYVVLCSLLSTAFKVTVEKLTKLKWRYLKLKGGFVLKYVTFRNHFKRVLSS
jgi:hypothetical protein